MSKNKIPDLKNVLNQNWPDATWTIPALFNNEQALIGLLSEIKKTFGVTLPIRSVYGSYPVMWNGGKSNLSPKHARHSYEKVLNDHINFAQVLHKHSKSSNTKLYNLGEGFPYNCSTVYSKQHFPLSEQIKQKIKKDGNK